MFDNALETAKTLKDKVGVAERARNLYKESSSSINSSPDRQNTSKKSSQINKSAQKNAQVVPCSDDFTQNITEKKDVVVIWKLKKELTNPLAF